MKNVVETREAVSSKEFGHEVAKYFEEMMTTRSDLERRLRQKQGFNPFWARMLSESDWMEKSHWERLRDLDRWQEEYEEWKDTEFGSVA